MKVSNLHACLIRKLRRSLSLDEWKAFAAFHRRLKFDGEHFSMSYEQLAELSSWASKAH